MSPSGSNLTLGAIQAVYILFLKELPPQPLLRTSDTRARIAAAGQLVENPSENNRKGLSRTSGGLTTEARGDRNPAAEIEHGNA
jgi:hypothetical protein